MKNTNIEWTDHTLNFWWGCTKVSPACTHCYAESVSKVFGKRLFGTVPQWGAGKPRFERLHAARKEALALNKEAGKCRVIDSVVWIYRGSGQIIGQPETYRVTAVPHGIKAKDLNDGHRREFTRTEWETAPHWRPRVFVNSMSDWLDTEVPIEWLAFLLETLFLCPHLDFQLLTKRPADWFPRILEVEKMCAESYIGKPRTTPEFAWQDTRAFLEWITDWTTENHVPENLWIGTTVESQEWADKRIPHLLKIPARVRFLSCEPFLGPVEVHPGDRGGWLEGIEWLGDGQFRQLNARIHWVIAGGESGGKARPSHPDWFRSLRDQCQAAGVAFFFKQWGEFLPAGSEAAHLPQDKTYKSQWVQGGTITRPEGGEPIGTQCLMLRPGTALAGHLLDGIAHQAFPASVPQPPLNSAERETTANGA